MPETPADDSLTPLAKRPPCKRCAARDWRVEVRRKSRIRWLGETAFAIPDVIIFQGESGGWPGMEYEVWTCAQCGRAVRVAR